MEKDKLKHKSNNANVLLCASDLQDFLEENLCKSKDEKWTNDIFGAGWIAALMHVKVNFLEKIPCPNCKELTRQCACMRNICHKCGKPVGNITFTVCDECWDKD